MLSVALIKCRLSRRDPYGFTYGFTSGSYKHNETVWWDRGDHIVVRTSFRGKNAFGALVLNSVKAKCDVDGTVVSIIEQGP